MTFEMFHPLPPSLSRPAHLNNPFDYEPHPLCLIAADEVRAYIASKPQWTEELSAGKMLGVLVCEQADGTLGYLAAYSGQLGGREDWPWFVPAVFDYLQPEGHFKQEERRISAMNHRISALEADCNYRQLLSDVQRTMREGAEAVETYKRFIQQQKAERDARRQSTTLTAAEEAELIGHSQFQKAELRRIKKRWNDALAAVQERLHPVSQTIEALRRERHERSDQLQRWLFDQSCVSNAQGQYRSLSSIFLNTPQGVPPSGAGECCAPKLLNYAFTHQLRPLAIAEFWYGQSPRMEVRHHGQYYPACQGKCKPILEWMLGSLPSSSFHPHLFSFPTVAEVGEAIVISKPTGLLSVCGKDGQPSVESILTERYGRAWMVHRLDQDTSGLMVVALTREAYHHLQRQFLERTVEKHYTAVLDGIYHGRPQGTISLPLRPDPDDRPRQVVDPVYGKPAMTDYRVLSTNGGRTIVSLTPHTGRTHQLRMHCAHADGLALPIVGDRLYGRVADRLYLHADRLSFNHPVTGERLSFYDPAPF